MNIGAPVRALLVTAAIAGALTGCASNPATTDRTSGSGSAADGYFDVTHAEVFRNIDKYPNVARFCVEDLAFAATTSTTNEGIAKQPQLLRMPEWDSTLCGHEPT